MILTSWYSSPERASSFRNGAYINDISPSAAILPLPFPPFTKFRRHNLTPLPFELLDDILLYNASPLLILTGLAALTHATSNITCSSPITSGTLWYGNATHGSYESQVGILEAYGNAELLAKYPNTNVVAHNFTIIPCNSSYLNVTNPSPLVNSDSYIKLQFTDDPTNCLGLEFTGSADVFVIKQARSYVDDDSQAYQFWTRKETWHYLLPTGQKQPALEWNLQFNQYDTEEVTANPGVCFKGQECQDGEKYSLLVKP